MNFEIIDECEEKLKKFEYLKDCMNANDLVGIGNSII